MDAREAARAMKEIEAGQVDRGGDRRPHRRPHPARVRPGGAPVARVGLDAIGRGIRGVDLVTVAATVER